MLATRNKFHEIRENVGSATHADRAARLPRFVGFEGDASDRVGNLRIGIVGCGSVGRRMALDWARLQIRELYLIDPGRFESVDLLTQQIGPEDVGQSKARQTARRCKQISPATRVWACNRPIQDLAPTEFHEVDAVLLATDNLAAEIETGQRCHRLGIPMIQGSVDGPTLVAQVRLFRNDGPNSPCPACQYGAHEWAALNRELRYRCGGGTSGDVRTAPTMSTSFLCGMAADLAALQAFRLLLKLGAPLTDSLLEYCGYTHQAVASPLRRRRDCPCDHSPWDVQGAPGPLEGLTVRDLVARAGWSGESGISFEAQGVVFAERGTCQACRRAQAIGQFTAIDARPPCADCGGPVVLDPFYAHSLTPLAVLEPFQGRSLGELGAASVSAVTLRCGGRTVVIQEQEPIR